MGFDKFWHSDPLKCRILRLMQGTKNSPTEIPSVRSQLLTTDQGVQWTTLFIRAWNPPHEHETTRKEAFVTPARSCFHQISKLDFSLKTCKFRKMLTNFDFFEAKIEFWLLKKYWFSEGLRNFFKNNKISDFKIGRSEFINTHGANCHSGENPGI